MLKASKKEKEFKEFMKLNFRLDVLNIHGFSMVMAWYSNYITYRQLTFFDLFTAACYS